MSPPTTTEVDPGSGSAVRRTQSAGSKSSPSQSSIRPARRNTSTSFSPSSKRRASKRGSKHYHSGASKRPSKSISRRSNGSVFDDDLSSPRSRPGTIAARKRKSSRIRHHRLATRVIEEGLEDHMDTVKRIAKGLLTSIQTLQQRADDALFGGDAEDALSPHGAGSRARRSQAEAAPAHQQEEEQPGHDSADHVRDHLCVETPLLAQKKASSGISILDARGSAAVFAADDDHGDDSDDDNRGEKYGTRDLSATHDDGAETGSDDCDESGSDDDDDEFDVDEMLSRGKPRFSASDLYTRQARRSTAFISKAKRSSVVLQTGLASGVTTRSHGHTSGRLSPIDAGDERRGSEEREKDAAESGDESDHDADGNDGERGGANERAPRKHRASVNVLNCAVFTALKSGYGGPPSSLPSSTTTATTSTSDSVSASAAHLADYSNLGSQLGMIGESTDEATRRNTLLNSRSSCSDGNSEFPDSYFDHAVPEDMDYFEARRSTLSALLTRTGHIKMTYPVALEIALVVVKCMSSHWRIYHAAHHVFDVAGVSEPDVDPIQYLSALFHDIIYLQLDSGIASFVVNSLFDAGLRPARIVAEDDDDDDDDGATTSGDPDVAPVPSVIEGTEEEQINGLRNPAFILLGGDDVSNTLCIEAFGYQPGEIISSAPGTPGLNEFLSAVAAVQILQPFILPQYALHLAICIEATIPFRDPKCVPDLHSRALTLLNSLALEFPLIDTPFTKVEGASAARPVSPTTAESSSGERVGKDNEGAGDPKAQAKKEEGTSNDNDDSEKADKLPEGFLPIDEHGEERAEETFSDTIQHLAQVFVEDSCVVSQRDLQNFCLTDTRSFLTNTWKLLSENAPTLRFREEIDGHAPYQLKHWMAALNGNVKFFSFLMFQPQRVFPFFRRSHTKIEREAISAALIRNLRRARLYVSTRFVTACLFHALLAFGGVAVDDLPLQDILLHPRFKMNLGTAISHEELCNNVITNAATTAAKAKARGREKRNRHEAAMSQGNSDAVGSCEGQALPASIPVKRGSIMKGSGQNGATATASKKPRKCSKVSFGGVERATTNTIGNDDDVDDDEVAEISARGVGHVQQPGHPHDAHSSSSHMYEDNSSSGESSDYSSDDEESDGGWLSDSDEEEQREREFYKRQSYRLSPTATLTTNTSNVLPDMPFDFCAHDVLDRDYVKALLKHGIGYRHSLDDPQCSVTFDLFDSLCREDDERRRATVRESNDLVSNSERPVDWGLSLFNAVLASAQKYQNGDITALEFLEVFPRDPVITFFDRMRAAINKKLALYVCDFIANCDISVADVEQKDDEEPKDMTTTPSNTGELEASSPLFGLVTHCSAMGVAVDTALVQSVSSLVVDLLPSPEEDAADGNDGRFSFDKDDVTLVPISPARALSTHDDGGDDNDDGDDADDESLGDGSSRRAFFGSSDTKARMRLDSDEAALEATSSANHRRIRPAPLKQSIEQHSVHGRERGSGRDADANIDTRASFNDIDVLDDDLEELDIAEVTRILSDPDVLKNVRPLPTAPLEHQPTPILVVDADEDSDDAASPTFVLQSSSVDEPSSHSSSKKVDGQTARSADAATAESGSTFRSSSLGSRREGPPESTFAESGTVSNPTSRCGSPSCEGSPSRAADATRSISPRVAALKRSASMKIVYTPGNMANSRSSSNSGLSRSAYDLSGPLTASRPSIAVSRSSSSTHLDLAPALRVRSSPGPRSRSQSHSHSHSHRPSRSQTSASTFLTADHASQPQSRRMSIYHLVSSDGVDADRLHGDGGAGQRHRSESPMDRRLHITVDREIRRSSFYMPQDFFDDALTEGAGHMTPPTSGNDVTGPNNRSSNSNVRVSRRKSAASHQQSSRNSSLSRTQSAKDSDSQVNPSNFRWSPLPTGRCATPSPTTSPKAHRSQRFGSKNSDTSSRSQSFDDHSNVASAKNSADFSALSPQSSMSPTPQSARRRSHGGYRYHAPTTGTENASLSSQGSSALANTNSSTSLPNTSTTAAVYYYYGSASNSSSRISSRTSSFVNASSRGSQQELALGTDKSQEAAHDDHHHRGDGTDGQPKANFLQRRGAHKQPVPKMGAGRHKSHLSLVETSKSADGKKGRKLPSRHGSANSTGSSRSSRPSSLKYSRSEGGKSRLSPTRTASVPNVATASVSLQAHSKGGNDTEAKTGSNAHTHSSSSTNSHEEQPHHGGRGKQNDSRGCGRGRGRTRDHEHNHHHHHHQHHQHRREANASPSTRDANRHGSSTDESGLRDDRQNDGTSPVASDAADTSPVQTDQLEQEEEENDDDDDDDDDGDGEKFRRGFAWPSWSRKLVASVSVMVSECECDEGSRRGSEELRQQPPLSPPSALPATRLRDLPPLCFQPNERQRESPPRSFSAPIDAPLPPLHHLSRSSHTPPQSPLGKRSGAGFTLPLGDEPARAKLASSLVPMLRSQSILERLQEPQQPSLVANYPSMPLRSHSASMVDEVMGEERKRREKVSGTTRSGHSGRSPRPKKGRGLKSATVTSQPASHSREKAPVAFPALFGKAHQLSGKQISPQTLPPVKASSTHMARGANRPRSTKKVGLQRLLAHGSSSSSSLSSECEATEPCQLRGLGVRQRKQQQAWTRVGKRSAEGSGEGRRGEGGARIDDMTMMMTDAQRTRSSPLFVLPHQHKG